MISSQALILMEFYPSCLKTASKKHFLTFPEVSGNDPRNQ
jgi:hypothetical protein